MKYQFIHSFIQEITKIRKTQSSVPSSTSETGSWPGLSSSSKHGSFVKLQKNGFIDLENMKNVGLAVIDATKATVFAINAKSEVEPEVDLEFRSHANMSALWKCQKWIPWPQKHFPFLVQRN